MFMRSSVEHEHSVADEYRQREIASQEQRLRRILRKSYLYLCKSRGRRKKQLLGKYYVVDHYGIMPIMRNVSLDWIEERLLRHGEP